MGLTKEKIYLDLSGMKENKPHFSLYKTGERFIQISGILKSIDFVKKESANVVYITIEDGEEYVLNCIWSYLTKDIVNALIGVEGYVSIKVYHNKGYNNCYITDSDNNIIKGKISIKEEKDTKLNWNELFDFYEKKFVVE